MNFMYFLINCNILKDTKGFHIKKCLQIVMLKRNNHCLTLAQTLCGTAQGRTSVASQCLHFCFKFTVPTECEIGYLKI